MLAQLEVKEINSRTFEDFCWFSRTSTDFQGLSSSRTFQDFQGPWTACFEFSPWIIKSTLLYGKHHFRQNGGLWLAEKHFQRDRRPIA
jgi:hypothetical protein